MTRSSAGDRDRRIGLWTAADKGLFTSDLSQALINGEADAAVHSWKDLPIESYPGTLVAATLERADPRDVLVVRREVARSRPASLTVLSSSPRRAWQLQTSARRFMPWLVEELRMSPVRGNIPTRLTKLVGAEGDALVVAKAALDRLLSVDTPGATAQSVRAALDQCVWMVLPVREYPTAPAQSALAVEVARERHDLQEYVRAINHSATWNAVAHERRVLESFGGGCQEAVGATVLVRDFGQVTSIRAFVGDAETSSWSLETTAPLPPPAMAGRIWPRLDERSVAQRRPLNVVPPVDAAGLWVSRAEALPDGWVPREDQLIWAAGSRTWDRLAARGVWVNGCADGLGDGEQPGVDLLAGRSIRWQRLTHAASGDPDALATYVVERVLPPDLSWRTHFFWTSGSAFLQALAAHPSLREAWHASGPGRTATVIRDTLGSSARASVWLDYDQWHRHVTS